MSVTKEEFEQASSIWDKDGTVVVSDCACGSYLI
jgi:hypothetical protein